MNKQDIRRIINILKVPFRVAKGAEKNQTILLEFSKKRPKSEIHEETKKKIAKVMEERGIKVFLEKTLYLNGIRIRPDICFLKNDRWNIIEIEFGNDYQNNIFKNYDVISRIANIKVVNIKAKDSSEIPL